MAASSSSAAASASATSSSCSTTTTRVLKLKSSDGVIFGLEESICMQMGTIQAMISDSVDEVNTFPLSNVCSKILAKVVKWCKFHATINKGETKEKEEEEKKRVKRWEDEFVMLDVNMLYDMIMAANYLDVAPLLDRLCKRVADLIKGKSGEQIRRLFDIKNDLNL